MGNSSQNDTLAPTRCARTGSAVAERLLEDWASAVPQFVKVVPHDYKRALEDLEIEPKGDNPTSTGSGFLTTESEEAA